MFKGKESIRLKALCIFEDGDDIFVSEMYDSAKKDFFYRPIGGTVEFGEFSEATLVREIREELNTEVSNVRLEMVLENIFTCDGVAGHEIDFMYRADFSDVRFYERREYELTESDQTKVKARWMSRLDFINRKYRLVPERLVEWLSEGKQT